VIAISNWQFCTLCITHLESKNLRQRSDGTCSCIGSRLWSVWSHGKDVSLYMVDSRITNWMLYFLRAILFPTYYSNLLIRWFLLISTRGGAVGLGTALQAGRSRVWFPMVLLGFLIDIILPATLWPWRRLSL
jgi:hypothetical protein